MTSDLPRNERRLIKLFRRLALFSTSFWKGRFSFFPKSFAVGLLVAFMPVESQRIALRAAHAKSYALLPRSGVRKSEDTPVEKCSKARRVPTETGFKLRVALPRSQQSKGYPSVTFCPIAGPSHAGVSVRRTIRQYRTPDWAVLQSTPGPHERRQVASLGPAELAAEEFRQPQGCCAGYENFWDHHILEAATSSSDSICFEAHVESLSLPI